MWKAAPILMLLAGCASGYAWQKAGRDPSIPIDPEETGRAMAACYEQAKPRGPLVLVVDYDPTIFDACMRGRGFEQVPVPQ